MSALIQLNNICKHFITEEIETRAVNNIDLTIHKGDYISLSGPSGCGKSTLLSILGLLDSASSGTYTLDGHDVSKLNRSQRANIRNNQVGFVFQSFNLISDLSVAENVMLPLTYQKGLDKKLILSKVNDVLEKVEMSHRKNHYPSQLSGGQQQRVAVARALVNEPSFILADEPTGNLDSKNAQAVMHLLSELHQAGSTICMVTHDPRSAELASRRVEMFDGQIVTDSISNTANKNADTVILETALA
ncbi:ABC transporter ATP-binding protein [Aliikangiella sp. IMCC44632]